MKKWGIIIGVWIIGTLGVWRFVYYPQCGWKADDTGPIVLAAFFSLFILAILFVYCELASMIKAGVKRNKKWDEEVKTHNLQSIIFDTEHLRCQKSGHYNHYGDDYRMYFLPIDDPPKEIKVKSEEKEFTYLLKE